MSTRRHEPVSLPAQVRSARMDDGGSATIQGATAAYESWLAEQTPLVARDLAYKHAQMAADRFLIHDRDSIFSHDLDKAVAAMGVRVLRTPPRAPQANAVCERLVGTIRRECLDFFIPLGQRHLKNILNRWVLHYNHGRVHMSLGPGIPAPLHPSAGCPAL